MWMRISLSAMVKRRQARVDTATPTMSCDDCFKTVAHSGTPVGHTETIAGVPTYVSEPPGPAQNKILLFFADVFGPFYINSQLVQDWFASNGTHPPCMHPTVLTRTQATPYSASITSLATGSRRSGNSPTSSAKPGATRSSHKQASSPQSGSRQSDNATVRDTLHPVYALTLDQARPTSSTLQSVRRLSLPRPSTHIAQVTVSGRLMYFPSQTIRRLTSQQVRLSSDLGAFHV